MAIPPLNVNYLRFVLHDQSDGILMARKRPASLPIPVADPRDLRALLRVLISLGVEKIRLAGDDPAGRRDLEDVVRFVASLQGVNEVALTTHGVGLAARLERLRSKGLSAINVNIDSLNAKIYRSLTGTAGSKEARRTIDEALALNLNVKLNVVIHQGVNEAEIPDFVALTKDLPLHVRFLEWNSAADRIAPPARFRSTRETMAAIKPPLIPREPSALEGPALVYGLPDHEGTVGFIPNITEHFCDTCNRLGLTDTGEIKSCIFGRGLDLLRHLHAPGGTASVAAFLDRVLRRKVLLASKLRGFPGVAAAVEPAGIVHSTS